MSFFSLISHIFKTIVIGFTLIASNTAAITTNMVHISIPSWKELHTLQENLAGKVATTSLPAPQKNETGTSTAKTLAGTVSQQATSTPKKTPTTTPKLPVVPKAAPQPVATPATPLSQPQSPAPVPVVQTPTEAPGALNTSVRGALVNVLCVTGGGGPLRPISGSGVIIDPRGVVLTNAHVGQFFLLKDYPSQNNIECLLRTGSPAQATYRAKLLYFPIGWLKVNAAKIIQENPTGTGERDYALLYITGSSNPNGTLPASFPYVAPYAGDTTISGSDILLAGYPAGFLGGATIQTNLYISSAFGKIGQIYTFYEGGGEDLVSIPGTILSQKGASGGAAVRVSDGTLLGIITTSTSADSTAQRDLRAVTTHHINESLTEDIGQNLATFLSGDIAAKAEVFNITSVPTLTRMLTEVLDK